jgi:hypothetical protein
VVGRNQKVPENSTITRLSIVPNSMPRRPSRTSVSSPSSTWSILNSPAFQCRKYNVSRTKPKDRVLLAATVLQTQALALSL